MRRHFAALKLLALLPLLYVINLPAAPAPEPAHAILDIGPPPKGKTAEEHCKNIIERLTKPRGFIWYAGIQPEVRKLASVARLKDAHPWLEKNIRVTKEGGERRLRVSFRAGTRTEQVTIINALLSVYFREDVTSHINRLEKTLRWEEKCIVDLEERIKSGQFRDSVDSYQKEINKLRTNRIPARIAEVNRLKTITVIKRAK